MLRVALHVLEDQLVIENIKPQAAAHVAAEHELETTAAANAINELAVIANAAWVSMTTGIFAMFPGLHPSKTPMKPSAKAGKKGFFGKMALVKAKPARVCAVAAAIALLGGRPS